MKDIKNVKMRTRFLFWGSGHFTENRFTENHHLGRINHNASQLVGETYLSVKWFSVKWTRPIKIIYLCLLTFFLQRIKWIKWGLIWFVANWDFKFIIVLVLETFHVFFFTVGKRIFNIRLFDSALKNGKHWLLQSVYST